MTLRIGELIASGELSNLTRNCVQGWVEMSSGQRIKIELTGDLTGQFFGRSFRFKVSDLQSEHPAGMQGEMPDCIEAMAETQSGTVGGVWFRIAKIPVVPIAELYQTEKSNDPSMWVQEPLLVVEWFGTLGRVVAEILNAEVEFTDSVDGAPEFPSPEPLVTDCPEQGTGISITEISLSDEGESTIEDVTNPDRQSHQDEYGLFQPNLDKLIGESLESGNQNVSHRGERSPMSGPCGVELPPGFETRAQAMFEQMDEMCGEDGEVPIGDLLDPPLRLPPVDQVTSDEQADPLVDMILDRLSEYGIGIGECDHATSLNFYRVIVNGILPDAKVHPKLKDSGGTMNYCMWAYCPECLAEFDGDCEDDDDDE